MSEDKKQAPIQTLRDGAIVVKLWRQDGKKGPYVSATLGRTYKNEETGEYGESRSLSGSDVLKAQALLGEANKEMILWRDYYREIQRQQQPDQPGANPQARQQTDQPTQGLAAQRDAALSYVKQSTQRGANRHHSPER